MRRTALLLPALALVLTGCGSDSDGAASGTKSTATVKAGDTTCEVSTTSFPAGEIELAVTNTGKDVTEVYVYGKGSDGDFDKVVGEVENIAPGAERDFEVKVGGGSYEVACKPGQKGDGIRTAIEVTGASSDNAAKYDREVELELTSSGLEGFDGFTGKVGEKVEFKLENKTDAEVEEFEVLGPDGKKIGEAEGIKAGEDGEFIAELATAGTYSYVVETPGGDKKGTFTVA